LQRRRSSAAAATGLPADIFAEKKEEQCKSTNHGKSLHYDVICIVSVHRGFFFMLLYNPLFFSI
jgi:hypothetical protein